MVSRSNNLTACVNFCILMIGIGILTVGITMAVTPISSCHTLLVSPCIKLGSLIVVVSLCGVLGSYCRSPFLLWIYLVFYFIIIIAMVIGAVLWLRVMSKGHVKLDVGQEYRFKEFASWFKDVVFGMMADWPEIRKCIMDRDLCLMDDSRKSYFYSIPKMKSACCQLPPWCNLDANNATIPDCHTWTTEKDKMCYYCDACIGGFLSQVTELWRRLFPGYVALLIFVIAVFTLGFRAFRQHKADHYSKVCYTTKA